MRPSTTSISAKSNKRGASLTGYGLVVGLIAVVGIGAITSIGGEVDGLFSTVGGELDSVVNDADTALPQPSASASPSALYSFSSHTFTNCGQSGSTGPDLSACQAAYSSQPWASDTNLFNITTPGVQQWTVPDTGTYRFTLNGASGGVHYAGAVNPGYGGRVVGERYLTAGDVLYILVGQGGDAFDDGGSGSNYFVTGGFNGGGGTGFSTNNCGNCSHASGGGASDVRLGGTTLNDRIIVAGGGAGSSTETGGSDPRKGGNGGGLTGENGQRTHFGSGGGQSAGGAANGSSPGEAGTFGQGGRGHVNDSSGGGGGWYGGAGGGNNSSGGGGSSYTDGSFTSVVHTQGANTATHGSVLIELLP